MVDWLNIKGKTVIVTGGASGIGEAVVNEFINLGANVVVGDLVEKDSDNDRLMYVNCDVTNICDVRNIVEQTVEKFGTVDILVNNAGVNIPCLLVDEKDPGGRYELNEDIYQKMVDINIKGVYLCAQQVGRVMVKNNYGVIINMSSESGIEGSEGQSIYAATKNAVNSFTRSWAKELGKYNVRVVGVAPGILEETGLRTAAYEEALSYTRGISVEKLREGYTSTKTTPLGRDGKLSEVANLVVFLASDKAGFIHGTTYTIAGGKTRG